MEIARSSRLRRMRDRLHTDATAVDELRTILRNDPSFAYAQLLAARHRIWSSSEHVLPPVAAAFEEALSDEDIEKLGKLSLQMPKLESLVLLAQAVLGDASAAEKVAKRLFSPNKDDDKQAIEILCNRFQPVVDLIEGGLKPAEAVSRCADHLRIAIYDTNEATSAPELMVA